jgi:transposase
MEAARLLRQGLSQSEVARRVGVHRQSVSRWARELDQSGVRGLRKAPRSGRPAKLDRGQLAKLELALKLGPEALGYSSGLWTARRVRDLIEYQTGVRYHEDHVWRILRKLNWSCQRPTGRAVERNEEGIRHWKKYRWPQIKKKPCAKGARSSSSTKAD